jgi:protein-L-isoaspartate(D-aspartate) O-methyltransferase
MLPPPAVVGATIESVPFGATFGNDHFPAIRSGNPRPGLVIMHDPQHAHPVCLETGRRGLVPGRPWSRRPTLSGALGAARRDLVRSGLVRLGLVCLGLVVLGFGQAAMSTGAAPADEARFAAARERLVNAIERDVVRTAEYLGTDRLDPAVIRAMRTVPREQFVPRQLQPQAYLDSPLPIGNGQTISQPYIVAVMSHLAGVQAGDRVYELGTGSGYQAAVLGAMGVTVYSVEIVPELAERAAATLARLGYDQVHVRAGDGYLGWPEAAPFDAVVVTAAHPRIPQPLVDQLKPGGRLVMPLGGTHEVQQLTVLIKQPDGSLQRQKVLPVRFVPVTGDAAERSSSTGSSSR